MVHALAVPARATYVDVDVPGWAWPLLVGVLVALLGLDLYRHREAHAPTAGEALRETLFWVGCGLAFGGVVFLWFGSEAFGEYLSGYLIEKSLSVDNVFVWALLFTTMAIPLIHQHRVLFWGVFGALVLRAAFIFVGTALLSKFWWLLIVFGVFLVWSGAKVVRHRADEGEDEAGHGQHFLRRFMPVTDQYEGQHFVTRIDGKRFATPLLAALVVIEITDVVFAVDSVPAILAVSHEPFLVFASNAFAILGLRAIYFLLADARERFHYLSHSLGAILILVGVKMTVEHWVHISTWISLAAITIVLVAGVVASQRRTKRAAAAAAAVTA